MRAAVLRQGRIVVDDVPDLTPGPGQVLIETIACGICGSDLHTVDHGHAMSRTAHEVGMGPFRFDPDRDMVMGHEISARVLALGDGPDGPAPGTAVAVMPSLTTPERKVTPGYDNEYPGGYCQQLLVDPGALVPVPNGLDPVVAALTEPLAVGLHAVNESPAQAGRAAIVIGAGPVGQSVILALGLAGVEPVIVSDYSPRRRALAAQLGAHAVVDPGQPVAGHDGFGSAVQAWREHTTGTEPPVIFEAVGVPGVIDGVLTSAPWRSELVVVGVCMEPDRFRPIMGIYKHLTVRFVLGWTPAEFRHSLQSLAEGRIAAEALITGHVTLDETPAAFAALANPEEHVKIMVRPNGVG
jgi:threonine dehydrogenase-like Zn-dependent dehydrogenase